jgi:hypothetical protein
LEFRGTPKIFVEEFLGILRNTIGTPNFNPRLQGRVSKIFLKKEKTVSACKK